MLLEDLGNNETHGIGSYVSDTLLAEEWIFLPSLARFDIENPLLLFPVPTSI